MTIKSNRPGIYKALIVQLDKTARYNRQGSFRTKERYYEAMKRFCRFLSDHYRLQKLANISGKHLTTYVLYMQERDKSASTIKTDLAAIRFFHDKMERTKYRLPTNDELSVELERRRFGQVDRTWSSREFNLFLATCMVDGREDFAAIACLTWYAGLRIHECFRIDTAIAAQAIRESAITIRGKGGKIRAVPIAVHLSGPPQNPGRRLRPPHDPPRSPAQLRRPDLPRADQRRHESPQCQLAGVPTAGPRTARCDKCVSGVYPKGRCRPWLSVPPPLTICPSPSEWRS